MLLLLLIFFYMNQPNLQFDLTYLLQPIFLTYKYVTWPDRLLKFRYKIGYYLRIQSYSVKLTLLHILKI